MANSKTSKTSKSPGRPRSVDREPSRPSLDARRCTWCGADPLYVAYHDEEWAVPERDDRALFEKLLLDGFQAGLSWITILRKRQSFRSAFDGFEPQRMARYGPRKIEALMRDAAIVRNRAKIEGAVASARAYLHLMEELGSFASFIWSFTDGRTLHHRYRSWKEIPASSTESHSMAKELKRRGFSFCGPTVCYAFMQAVGLVNDHVVECFRYPVIHKLTQ